MARGQWFRRVAHSRYETFRMASASRFADAINNPEDDALPWLTIEDCSSRRRGEDERDDRKVLLAINEDHTGGSRTTSSITSTSSSR